MFIVNKNKNNNSWLGFVLFYGGFVLSSGWLLFLSITLGWTLENIVGFKRLESFQLLFIVEKDERSGGVATGAEASGHRGGWVLGCGG